MSKPTASVAASAVVLAVCALVGPAGPRAEELPTTLGTLTLPRIELPQAAYRAESGFHAAIELSLGDLRPTAEPTIRFFDDYLAPKLNRQMDELAPAYPMFSEGEMIDYVLYDDLVASAERRARRGVKRAVSDYFIETTSLRHLVRSARSKKGPGGSYANFDVGLGISHWLPEVELRYRQACHSLRLRLSAYGSAGITFGHRYMTNTRIHFGWNAREDVFDLSVRLGF